MRPVPSQVLSHAPCGYCAHRQLWHEEGHVSWGRCWVSLGARPRTHGVFWDLWGPYTDLPPRLSADPDVVSLEAADRPNFFLCVTANGTLHLAQWQDSDTFRSGASFSLHRGTGRREGLVALESLAEPGAFLRAVGATLALQPHQHSEAFRRATLFRLLGRQRLRPGPLPAPPALSPRPAARLLTLPA